MMGDGERVGGTASCAQHGKSNIIQGSGREGISLTR